MRGTTHLAAGVLTALLLSSPTASLAAVAVGSVLPDIDTPISMISNKTTHLLGFFLEHRGITHSFLFATAATLASPYAGLGVLTHIALDMLNPPGVQAAWPSKRHWCYGRVPVGGWLDHLIGGADEKAFFIGKIIVDRRAGHLRAHGDILHHGLFIALLREKAS